MEKKNRSIARTGLTAILVIFLLLFSSLTWAQDNSQTKNEYGSTVTISGPFTVPPNQSYEIILSAHTDAPIYQWGLYQDSGFVVGSGFVFGQTLDVRRSFTQSSSGNHTYLLRFRGIAGAHGFPPYTEVLIRVNVVAPQPPAAPSTLVATAVSSSQIDLIWQDNSDNEQGFIIERKTPCAESYDQIANINKDVTNYSDTGLPPASVYYYRVKAFNEVGNSNYSNKDAAVTFANVPTAQQITNLLNQYYQEGLIKNYGIYNSLYAKSMAIAESINNKNYRSAVGQLNALTNELIALKNTSIDSITKVTLLNAVQILTEYQKFYSDLPITLTLYLSEVPCLNTSTIQVPTGGEIASVLTGNLDVRLEPTGIYNILTFNIINSSYAGTSLVYNDSSSDTLYFKQDPNNPSTGTVNLTTGEINMVERVLVTSAYLDILGLSPVSLEIPQKGTLSLDNMNPPLWRASFIGHGVMPQDLPIVAEMGLFSLCDVVQKGAEEIAKEILGIMQTITKSTNLKSLMKILQGIASAGKSATMTKNDVKELLQSMLDVYGMLADPARRDTLEFEVAVRDFLAKLEDVTGYSAGKNSTAVITILSHLLRETYTPSQADAIAQQLEKLIADP